MSKCEWLIVLNFDKRLLKIRSYPLERDAHLLMRYTWRDEDNLVIYLPGGIIRRRRLQVVGHKKLISQKILIKIW